MLHKTMKQEQQQSAKPASPLPSSLSLGHLIRHSKFSEVERQCHVDDSPVAFVGKYNLFSSKTDCYPLHYLCRRSRVPTSTLQAVIQTAPQAVVFPDSVYKSTPLHVACRNKTMSLVAIQVLIQANPKCQLMQDADGNLPLHIAASFQTPNVVLAMIQKCPPKCLEMENHTKKLVLHMACQREDMSVHVIQELVRLNIKAAGHQDWKNRCPIHHACMYQAQEPVLRALVEACPESCLVWDTGLLLTPVGIARKYWKWSSSSSVTNGAVADPRVELLQNAMQSKSKGFGALRNRLQFAVERASDSFLPL